MTRGKPRGIENAVWFAGGREGEREALPERRSPKRSTAALFAIACAASGCGGRGSAGTRPAAVSAPKLAPANPEAVREFDIAMGALRRGSDLGGPEGNRRAEAHLRSAVKRDPRLWEAWHNLGAVLYRRGDDEGAAEAFSRALALRPAHLPALAARADYESALRTAPGNPAMRARAASLLREMGRAGDAEDVLREGLRRSGGSSPIYLELGLVYLAQHKNQLAELILSKAAALDAKNPAIYNALALVSMERHRDQEAFERWDRATALDPGFLDARFNMASVLIDAGDYARARTELDAVLTARPDDLGAMVALGIAHRGLGDHKKARSLWSDVVNRAPPRASIRGDALFNLARLEMDFVMDEKSSRAALDRFLQESPANHPKRKEAEERRKELGQ